MLARNVRLVLIAAVAQLAATLPIHASETIKPPDEWFNRPYVSPPKLVMLSNEADIEGACDPYGPTGYVLKPNPHRNLRGCTVINLQNCRIFIRTDVSPEQFEATLHHEDAHCRGWPADHPLD